MKLTTAVPVSDEVKENIRKRIQYIERYKNSTLVLEEKVDDPSLVADLLSRSMMNYLMRASVMTFEFIKNQFVENMYIQKIR